MADKPTQESVAFCILDDDEAFLCVKRSLDDDSLPGVWGLPGATVRSGETPEDAVKRGARDKLGVEVEVGKMVGDGSKERDTYVLHLSEYEVRIVSGTPAPIAKDPTVSKYDAVQWATDPEVMREAAEKGSLCSRIFLSNRGLWPSEENGHAR